MVYILLKYVVWRLRIYNLFSEIFKSIIAHIFAIFKYITKQTVCSDSPDHVLQNDIQYVLMLRV